MDASTDHLDRLTEAAVFQTTGFSKIYLDNTENITESQGSQRRSPLQAQADSSAYSGLSSG